MAFLSRNISACAENTAQKKGSEWNLEKHLRMRGEYTPCLPICYGRGETSPHARRIHIRSKANALSVRNISACAENTPEHLKEKIQNQEHLRMRGEYRQTGQARIRQRETSPHARRIQLVLKYLLFRKRNISACAENTSLKEDL